MHGQIWALASSDLKHTDEEHKSLLLEGRFLELTDQACPAAAAAAAAPSVRAAPWQATTGRVAPTCTTLISWPQAGLTAAAVALLVPQFSSRKTI